MCVVAGLLAFVPHSYPGRDGFLSANNDASRLGLEAGLLHGLEVATTLAWVSAPWNTDAAARIDRIDYLVLTLEEMFLM